mgnify:CR=1 FL=1
MAADSILFVRLLLGAAACCGAASEENCQENCMPPGAAAVAVPCSVLVLMPPYCAASRASAALRLALFVLAVAAGEHPGDAGLRTERQEEQKQPR